MMTSDRKRIGSFEFSSPLFVGTGKYADFEIMKAALAASGCEVVTVAVRRDIAGFRMGRRRLRHRCVQLRQQLFVNIRRDQYELPAITLLKLHAALADAKAIVSRLGAIY